MMECDGAKTNMRILESDAASCGLHRYFAASLMNDDEGINTISTYLCIP